MSVCGNNLKGGNAQSQIMVTLRDCVRFGAEDAILLTEVRFCCTGTTSRGKSFHWQVLRSLCSECEKHDAFCKRKVALRFFQ